ncbi:T9SS type A sorting domain-containing protein [Larkinella sp. VNQ87]|uniref:T9SS type A sorting domain-containing protein n=1 Tax=Larkinella sp. VNQ87 TaxID=3400921 RepID=UPI003C081427
MKKIITFLLVLSALPGWGTHLVGGYIQVKRLSASPLFKFIVNVYIDNAGGAANEQITLCPGDGSGALSVPRKSLNRLENGLSLAIYEVDYMYSGTGSSSYTVSAQVPNRSQLTNLPNALQTPLYLETTFSASVVNALPVFQGPTPGSLTVPVNQKAVYNFQAKDEEGDSVVHYLVRIRNGECQRSQPVWEYVFPNDVTRRGTFKIDAKTGQLTWDAPTQTGIYDFAVVAEEWRNGQRISSTLFDMVTRVVDQPGTPGIIPPYEPVLERGLLTGLDERVDDTGLSVVVAPSPSQGRFQVVLKSQKPTTATFQLIDAQGKLIEEIKTGKTALEHQQAIGNEQLAPGLYLIRTSALGRILATKVLKR